MAEVTRIALKALEKLGGPRVVLAAIPGGIDRLAREAGVSEGRVSQVLRQERLPRSWAELIAGLTDCTIQEVYLQLGQAPVGSPLGPLFDAEGAVSKAAVVLPSPDLRADSTGSAGTENLPVGYSDVPPGVRRRVAASEVESAQEP